MITAFTKYSLYLVGIFAAFALAVLVFAGSVSGQSPSPDVSGNPSLELTYPIEDLAGCQDIGACMDYCQDPVNQTSCTNYAKEQGFYREDPVISADSTFWEKAKNELGCENQSACLEYCAQEANFEKCDEFTKKNGLDGGYTQDPDKPEFLQIAQEVLGCDSLDSCANVCNDPANSQKCSDFANRVGILGGEIQEGPGGCQTQNTCQAYCSDPANFTQCQAYAPGGSQFTGPGGCDSPDACRDYCEQNAESCRSYGPGANGNYVPIACGQNEFYGPQGVCTPVEKTQEAAACASSEKYWNGDSCEDDPPVGISTDLSANFEVRNDMGGCQTPGECYDWCKDNAGKCEGFNPDGTRPTDTYTPYVYYTPGTVVKFEPKADMGNCDSPGSCYDWCKDNAGECGGFDENSPRPLDTFVPGAYYTPPVDFIYVTPTATSFYTTPIYFTPPVGSNYTTPQYYTPGTYATPNYYTPPPGSNYVTPTYYTPGMPYFTPSGEYPTPNYPTPRYYTPPGVSGYTTPYYYTPPSYMTPYYYTPPAGSNYTTPSYSTPPTYTSPSYYTPYTGGNYTTPVYYTPPVYSTPTYYTPPPGSNYTTPSYYTPPPPYTSPSYYTPGVYPTPPTYTTPPPYTTPTYTTPPPGSTYTSPSYYTPAQYYTPTYYTPTTYYTPSYYSPYYYTPTGSYTTPSYSTPSYYYPSPSGDYTYPSPAYYSPSYVYPTPGGSYTYPSPSYYTPDGSYSYPTPSSYSYPTPDGSYSYPTPGSYSYPSPSYPTPSYSYPSPSYATPSYSYPSPSYATPSYGTPEYPTPSYSTPSSGRGSVAGTSTQGGVIGWFKTFVSRLFGR